MMKSTYSMRVYEIILSYDNGNRDYGYTNGLVFQPVNDEILNKFSSKRDELTGYKYKKFNIDEFKGLLSAPTEAERESTKSKKKKDPASADKKKFDREKPLSEKYKTFTEFEKNVLKTVKKEIKEMTDLWFDYAPARKRGVRKYEYLYIFIKYKTKAEMRDVRNTSTARAASRSCGRLRARWKAACPPASGCGRTRRSKAHTSWC